MTMMLMRGRSFGMWANSGSPLTSVALIEAPVDEILRNLADNSRANAFGHESDHLRMAHSDTVDYYRRAPADWLRLPERNADQLIAHLQRAAGTSLRLSSAESP